MQALYALIERIGHSTIPVVLLGETGSGKEVVAEWVHRCSPLSAAPFLRINCAGLSESIVESELFGHERGAFTGATSTQHGLFESADGGTLMLDELAELPLRTQAKLLRVLECGEFCRLGSTVVRQARVRFIAATHRALLELVESGAFRRDLYYRLSGARLYIPPLRERPQEIVPLAKHFLARAAAASGRSLQLGACAERALQSHAWPGNVRELRNAIEYAAALCGTALIDEQLLDLRPALEVASVAKRAPQTPAAVACAGAVAHGSLRQQLKHFERACIQSALARCGGNQTLAARELRISRRALVNKLTEHALDRPRKPSLRLLAAES
ncbi:MAG: hypothetical protein RL685_4101 [Pseudomonadota bacterium]|jgi:DNA-binding NtrC family response regulator